MLAFAQHQEESYTPTADLRRQLDQVPAFVNWKKSSKLGVDVKLQRLIATLENVASTNLFVDGEQRDELEVTRAVLAELLREAESALE
ncbi:MAG: hypothetical protein FWD61_15750 [Phycisphaerales bacterium]|nr:hypothetical protein [Phycisphaerales bacterium]